MSQNWNGYPSPPSQGPQQPPYYAPPQHYHYPQYHAAPQQKSIAGQIFLGLFLFFVVLPVASCVGCVAVSSVVSAVNE